MNNEKDFLKETVKVDFLDCTNISTNLVAIHHFILKSCVRSSQTSHVFLSLNCHEKTFGNINLIHTDTDSLICLVTRLISTKELANLAEYFDFSTYPKDHLLYKAHLPENKKMLGTIKN